jgi:hypothetical protein
VRPYGLGKPTTQLGTAQGAKSGSTVAATVDGETVTVEVARDLTVAAGDVLLIHKIGATRIACCRLFPGAVTLPDNELSPPAKPTVVTGTLTVPPVETRSYRAGLGWRTDADVHQGTYGGFGNHTGAAFYGSKPSSLAGATVTAASVLLQRADTGATGAVATTMRLVTETTRPAGAPTLTSTTAGPSLRRRERDTFTVPTAWAQAMVDGTAGGLGFFDADGDPYVVFDGRGRWAPAFTLSINWQR